MAQMGGKKLQKLLRVRPCFYKKKITDFLIEMKMPLPSGISRISTVTIISAQIVNIVTADSDSERTWSSVPSSARSTTSS